MLHDEIVMEIEPVPSDAETDLEFTEEENIAGARNVFGTREFGPASAHQKLTTNPVVGTFAIRLRAM